MVHFFENQNYQSSLKKKYVTGVALYLLKKWRL
jgi:hypothetical protein